MNKRIEELESELKEAKDELSKTREELAEASAASLTSPAELEQAGLGRAASCVASSRSPRAASLP